MACNRSRVEGLDVVVTAPHVVHPLGDCAEGVHAALVVKLHTVVPVAALRA